MKGLRSLGLGLVLAWAVGGPIAAEPGSWGTLTATTGVDFRRGDYGLERDTELWYAPLTVKLLLEDFGLTPTAGDQLEFGVTLPYLDIRGPVGVVAIEGAVPVDRPDGSTRSEHDRGIGDVVLRGTYLWRPYPTDWLPAIELTGRLKLPTGDEDEGLGIGTLEGSGQLDVYRSFGPITPFASVGYRGFGHSDDFDLEDGWLASGGLIARFHEAVSGGVFVDWREAASRSADDPLELTPYLAVRCGSRWTLSPYAVAGLSDGSPDFGFGLQLSVALELPDSRP
jgi:hypothetical protein